MDQASPLKLKISEQAPFDDERLTMVGNQTTIEIRSGNILGGFSMNKLVSGAQANLGGQFERNSDAIASNTFEVDFDFESRPMQVPRLNEGGAGFYVGRKRSKYESEDSGQEDSHTPTGLDLDP